MFNRPNDKLINGCTTILEKFCKKEHHSLSLLSSDEFYSLSCNNPIIVNHEGNQYNVAAFNNTAILGFNFALKFDIITITNKKQQYNLTDANIKVFHLNDDFSHLLFRAEFATNAKINHAQPHWQFEPYIIKTAKETDFNTLLELKTEEVEMVELESVSNSINISKFHFSMSSDWCKPSRDQLPNSHVTLITEDNVITWLDGCMNYIMHQFKL